MLPVVKADFSTQIASHARIWVKLTSTAKMYFYKNHDTRYDTRHLGRKIRAELEPIAAIYFLNHKIIYKVFA